MNNCDTNNKVTIKAHNSNISCLALNSDGSLVATASDKGTLIRIYRSDNGEFLQEVRRGKENAEIYTISFNNSNQFLACTSDRGTIHIFSLDKVIEKIKDLKKDEYKVNINYSKTEVNVDIPDQVIVKNTTSL